MELTEQASPEDHLSCLHGFCRATENAFDVRAWRLACPHLASFFRPVAAFQEDVSYRLGSISAWAFVGVRSVNSVEVG